MASVGGKAIADLGSEFAGGCKHQGANFARSFGGGIAFACGEHAVQSGESKSGCFAGACLGAADEVVAFHDNGDGFGLDGGGDLVAAILDRANEGFGQLQIFEFRQ